MIFTILLLIPFCAYAGPRAGLFAAAVGGLLLDIWFAQPLGEMAFTLVVTAFLINWYKNKFNAKNFFFLAAFTAIAIGIIQIYMVSYAMSVELIKQSVVYALAVIPISFLYRLLWMQTKGVEKRSF